VGKGKPPQIPTASPSSDDENRLLFEREMAGAKPLGGPTRVPLSPGDGPPPGRRAPSARRADALVVNRTGDQVSGARAGVSHQLLHDLGSGREPAAATCDLHGLRAEAARLRLRAFITSAVDHDRRVVLVVCGRGLHSGSAGPVLLDLAIETLCERPLADHVLAFVNAAPAEGGLGALRVQLRRRRADREG
jgi:DNA-nicking Smr family endonuclease